MATVATASPTPVNLRREHADDGIMDTRTGSPVQRSASSPGPAAHLDNQADAREPHKSQDGSDYKPDLSAEVAMLSTKLVNAINYQTNLDDSLQATRHELEHTQAQLSRVSQAKAKYDDDITNGILVKKAHVDAQIAKLREELAKEKAAREASEKSRKQTEGELENLTTALFEEANGMVAAARKDTEASEKRNSHLRSQLSDTEELLASQQGQLQDLKTVMERMERASSEQEAAGHRDPSVPSTPINPTTATWDALQFSPNGAALAEVPPNHPLHFSQLLVPVMRNDVSAYADFQELLASARRAMPHSRGNSGSTHKLASASQPDLRTASSPVVPGAFSFGAGLGISNASGPSSSNNNSPNSSTFGSSSASHQQSAPLLKETKFYKRTLTEDLEPTLRLDLAPGLSFLSRRTVLSALLNGTLAVEPFLPSTKFYGPVFACALCAESRKSEPYVRKHRFRTSESDDAQRYPLCDYCLNRIRAVGDFLGFLRMLRDGHWRCESEAEARGAWDEATRLRERMFWARLGGGVVPAVPGRGGAVAASSVAGVSEDGGGASPITTPAGKSARQSLESIPERRGGGDGVAEGGQKVVGDGGGGAEERQDPDGVPVVEAKKDVPELVAQPTPQLSRRRSSAAGDQNIARASPVVLATGTPGASHQLAASEEEEEEEEAADAEIQALDGGGKTSVEHPQLAPESTSQPLDDGNAEQTPEQSSKDPAPSAVEGGNGDNAVEEYPVDRKAPLDDELQTAPPPPEKKEEFPRPDVEAEDAARSRGEEMSHEEASKGDDEEPAPSQPSAVEDKNDDEQASAISPSAADAVQGHSPPPTAQADTAASVSPPSPPASAAVAAAETPGIPVINEPEPSPPQSSPPAAEAEKTGPDTPSSPSSSSVPEHPPPQPAQQEQEQEHQASDPPPSSSSSSSCSAQHPDSLPTPTGPQTQTQTQTTKPEPRRPSGVMARVKAMEAKAQAAEADKGDKAETKLPGAFE
ncbi:hypothetical protein KC340_g3256 [Hortaea werneckii]|nr:hypothetical protein KC340_g3256 [Hortaea werneckii]KAI7399568.1 hypothetical protein KC328_g3983 [Hortaea werneckii]